MSNFYLKDKKLFEVSMKDWNLQCTSIFRVFHGFWKIRRRGQVTRHKMRNYEKNCLVMTKMKAKTSRYMVLVFISILQYSGGFFVLFWFVFCFFVGWRVGNYIQKTETEIYLGRFSYFRLVICLLFCFLFCFCFLVFLLFVCERLLFEYLSWQKFAPQRVGTMATI